MFCRKCGNEVKKDSEFCGRCGAPVKIQVNNIDNQKENVRRKKKRGFIIAIIIIVCILIGFVIIGAFYIYNMDDLKENIQSTNEEGKLEKNTIKMPVKMEIDDGEKEIRTWNYDETGIPVSLEEKVNDRLIETIYSDDIEVKTNRNSEGVIEYQCTKKYDEEGNLSEKQEENLDSEYGWMLYKEVYDKNGNIVYDLGWINEEISGRTEYEYDAKNRPIGTYDPMDGDTSSIFYEESEDGLITKKIERRGEWIGYSEYEYYNDGRCKSIKEYTNSSDEWEKMNVLENGLKITYETEEGTCYQITRKNQDEILIDFFENDNHSSNGVICFDGEGDISSYQHPNLKINIEYQMINAEDIQRSQKFKKRIMDYWNQRILQRIGLEPKSRDYILENWMKSY